MSGNKKDVGKIVRGYINSILNNKTSSRDRQGIKFSLVKEMKKDPEFADFVALMIVNKLQPMRIEERDENALFNVLSIALGGHGITFSPEVQGRIERMKKWKKWEKLSDNSELRHLLRK